jgi:hypothetical protein
MQRLHDCREAGGRTTQGAVVEEQISAHAVVFVKEGGNHRAIRNNPNSGKLLVTISLAYLRF